MNPDSFSVAGVRRLRDRQRETTAQEILAATEQEIVEKGLHAITVADIAARAGLAVGTLYNHYNSPCGQMSAGVWEGEVGHWKVNYTEHEYCEIVQGVSVLRDVDGNAKTLRAGDRFVIPAGFSGTWEVLEACRKIYVVFEQKA